MTEPVSAGLGIKLASVVGGAIGSAVTLANLPKMGPWQRLAAYGTGLASAAYLPPLVSYFGHLPPLLDGPLGFVAGTAGMGVAGFIVRISNDPIAAWRRFKGETNSGEGQP